MKILNWLQLALIVLKLCNVVTWPWELVLLPLILLYAAPVFVWVIGCVLILGDHALMWLWDRLPQWLRDRLP
jgi:hypothetical protein